jgi:membrane-bound lytic murein transglycosylase
MATVQQPNSYVAPIQEPQPPSNYGASTNYNHPAQSAENTVVSLEDARRMEAETKSQWNDLENKRSAQMHRAQGSNQTALQIKQQLVSAKQEVKDAKERRKVIEKRLNTAKREAKDAKKLQKDYEREMNILERKLKDTSKIIHEAEKRELKSK